MMTVIPLLVFVYVYDRVLAGEASLWHVAVCAMASAVGLAGYASLRRHPSQMSRIRRSIEKALTDVSASLPPAPSARSDAEIVDQGLSALLSRLTMRVEASTREKARLERELNLARKIESLSALATGIAHDFNNLLAAVHGNLGIARRHCAEGPALQHIQQAEAITEKAISLASELLLYSGRGHFDAVQVDLSGLVKEQSETLQKSMPPGVKIEYRLAGSMPCFWGDPKLIAAALRHLIVNAAESYQGGDGRVRIVTEARHFARNELAECVFEAGLAEDLYAVLRVEDDGCGIPPRNMERIFDPFFSTKIRGRGMGLPVILGVMRAHAGGLIVRSEPGRGTTVSLLFPTSRPRTDPL